MAAQADLTVPGAAGAVELLRTLADAAGAEPNPGLREPCDPRT